MWKKLVLVAWSCVLPTYSWAGPPACDSPPRARLSAAVVELTFSYAEPNETGSSGHRGTGVFVTPSRIATVEHVVPDSLITRGDMVTVGWSLEIGESVVEYLELPIVEVEYIDTGLSERIALIELQAGILGRTAVGIRYAPLLEREPVFGIGYRDEVLQFVNGRHFLPKTAQEAGSGETSTPPLFFELAHWEELDRLVFDYGSSGAPIFDCDGMVVAFVSQVITQNINLGGFAEVFSGLGMQQEKVMRVSTAWGTPNVIGLHASRVVLD